MVENLNLFGQEPVPQGIIHTHTHVHMLQLVLLSDVEGLTCTIYIIYMLYINFISKR